MHLLNDVATITGSVEVEGCLCASALLESVMVEGPACSCWALRNANFGSSLIPTLFSGSTFSDGEAALSSSVGATASSDSTFSSWQVLESQVRRNASAAQTNSRPSASSISILVPIAEIWMAAV